MPNVGDIEATEFLQAQEEKRLCVILCLERSVEEFKQLPSCPDCDSISITGLQ
jgi:hypothetical protein